MLVKLKMITLSKLSNVALNEFIWREQPYENKFTCLKKFFLNYYESMSLDQDNSFVFEDSHRIIKFWYLAGDNFSLVNYNLKKEQIAMLDH